MIGTLLTIPLTPRTAYWLRGAAPLGTAAGTGPASLARKETRCTLLAPAGFEHLFGAAGASALRTRLPAAGHCAVAAAFALHAPQTMGYWRGGGYLLKLLQRTFFPLSSFIYSSLQAF